MVYAMRLFLPVLFLFVYGAKSDDNCKIMTCSNPNKHILCLHPEDKIADSCNIHVSSGIDNKNSLLIAHNSYRGFGADGEITKKFVWDDSLELMAQRWANQCPRVKDDCRALKKFESVAYQNIAVVTVPINRDGSSQEVNFTSIVDDWAMTPNNPIIPHNPVYKILDRVGCGVTKTKKCQMASMGRAMMNPQCSFYYYYLICNYARTTKAPEEN